MSVEFSNIPEVFHRLASRHPSKDALLFLREGAYRSETYDALLKKSAIFKKFLIEKGVKPGMRVAVLLENRPEFSWISMGIFSTGAAMVPFDTQYASDVVEKLVDHSGAKFIISIEKFQNQHIHFIPKSWILIDHLNIFTKETMAEQETDGFSFDIPREDPAAFFYTSGTTDEPKAVILTHGNLLANVSSIQKADVVKSDDVVTSILPLHHTYAFTVTLLLPLLSGMTIAYPKSLASGDLLDCIKQTCTTAFVGVPQIFALIHRAIKDQIAQMNSGGKMIVGMAERLSSIARRWGKIDIASKIFHKIHQRFGPSLRVMVSGGARLDPVIAQDFYRWGFTLVEGYGLTETSPVVSFSIPNNPKFGSVGKALPGVSIRIHNPDQNGEGEVIVKGDNVMQGYYQLDQETQRVLRDGWFYTGDIGRIDEEGFLFLTGRKKEMLVLTNGENINPEELEIFYGQNPFIKEMAVLTVHDSKKTVELTRLVAIIVPDENHFRQEQELHIQKRLRWELENYSSQLPTYKRIRGFAVSQEALPRTRLGKLKRFEMEEIYHRLQAGEVRDRLPKAEVVYSEFSLTVIRFIEAKLGQKISADDHLELDLGLDSLDRLELFTAIQKRLSLVLTEDESSEFFTCATVGQVLEKLKKFADAKGVVLDNDAPKPEGFSAMAKSALTYLEDQAGRDVSLDDHLELDLGLDSLSRVELLLGIQEKLGLSLNEDDAVRFFMCSKVGDLLDELNRVVADMETYRTGVADWRDVLFKDPEESALKQIQVTPPGFFGKIFSGVIITFLRVLFKACFMLRAEGLENLPKNGPFILCANHTTYLDGIFIAISMPFRVSMQTFFLGDAQFLDHWVLKPFKKIIRLISIQFTYRMVNAMKLCSYVLRNDRVLCYFPEGQRSIDGEVKEFRKGIGVLIRELDVPVVPIYINGAFSVWPRGQKWPRLGRVSVCFGTPVSAQELMFKMTDSEDIYERVSENLREKVKALSPAKHS